ncbi:hypothetical protein MVEN_01276800 [Mycena venus]|uniref:BOD1/SHG1 domain-containing protein n=1 Tax=Mycena venus TaxID=2733690 RepID=A0A8H6Y2V1_9AGAR|nr:hypothetical protein MVEN_01276800 [Mycena venus]
MPISDPNDLVAEFKKSGEFDKLRRELLADCQRSSGFDAFKARIEEIARDRIESGQTAYTAPELLHKELMQEINRFPVVDRFASDVPMLSDSVFKDGIHASFQRILREDRGQKDPPPARPEHAAPSQPSVAPPGDSDPSVKEGEEAPAPALPPQEPALVPQVPPGTAPEAHLDGKDMDIDTIDPAPLTDAPETVMSSPKSSPLSSPPGAS